MEVGKGKRWSGSPEKITWRKAGELCQGYEKLKKVQRRNWKKKPKEQKMMHASICLIYLPYISSNKNKAWHIVSARWIVAE